MTDLFTPLQLGAITAPNRILMAPLTRCRAGDGHVPNALMAEYYAQRASAGLLIAEATMAMAGNSAFWHEPGIYSAGQVAGWKLTTDAVHAAGGRIFLQIWHGGRACHPLLNDGAQPVAPSALAITGDEVHTPQGKQPYVLPRELRDDELPAIVAGFRKAAENAKAAGFDGVEVHGANGYLLDEFLRDGANQRGGPYGGSRGKPRAAAVRSGRGGQCGMGQRPGRAADFAAEQLQQHDRQRSGRPRHLPRQTPQRLASWPTCMPCAAISSACRRAT
jgi:N-ethylmaleimide reductase